MAGFADAVLRPGRAGLLYFGLSLWLFHGRVTRVSTLNVGAAQTEVIWPWIVFGLPLVGTAVAWRSRTAHGTRAQRILAAIFPAIVPALVLCVTTGGDIVRRTCGTAVECLNMAAAHWLAWIILPAAALACGALPFVLRANRPEDAPQG